MFLVRLDNDQAVSNFTMTETALKLEIVCELHNVLSMIIHDHDTKLVKKCDVQDSMPLTVVTVTPH